MPPTTLQRIALFGTSADPPHRGHREILHWLTTQFDHVAVWAADNPYKQHRSPLGDRIAMVDLMIRDIPGWPITIALHNELSHPRSLISVQRAQHHWPGGQFTLVVGADLVHQLPHWHQAQALLSQVRVLVMPRPGFPLTENDLAGVRQRGGTIAIAPIPTQVDLSSSYYRQTDDPDAIPSAVRAYIHQKNLYSPWPKNSREKQPIPPRH